MNKRKLANKYIKALREGNLSAFDLIYKNFYGYIYGIAKFYTHDKSYVEDVVMRTFEVVYERRNDFDETKNGYAWMVQIAKYSAMQYNDSEYKYILSAMDEQSCVSNYQVDFEGDYNVQCAMEKLCDLDRKIVYFRFFEDKTIEFIAQKLGMSVAAIYKRLQKSKKYLKNFFKKR